MCGRGIAVVSAFIFFTGCESFSRGEALPPEKSTTQRREV